MTDGQGKLNASTSSPDIKITPEQAMENHNKIKGGVSDSKRYDDTNIDYLIARNLEVKANTTRKNWVLGFVIFFVLFLYGSAILFAFKALSALTNRSILGFGIELIPYRLNTTPNLDWHILLVVSSFLIPPTILLFLTIKGVFNMSTKTGDTPVQEIIQNGKDIAESTIDTADAAEGFFSNLFGKLTGK